LKDRKVKSMKRKKKIEFRHRRVPIAARTHTCRNVTGLSKKSVVARFLSGRISVCHA
jgi:hypothetical protein